MRRIFSVLLLLAATAIPAAAQDAHYTYPFELVCPDMLVSPGETVAVTARFENGNTGERYRPSYNWTTTSGTFESGQGTQSIRLAIAREEVSMVTVTLNRTFQEAHYPFVQREASCSIAIIERPAANLVDDFRTGGNNCEEGFARLDSFFSELNNNPSAAGLIVIQGDARDAKAAGRREQQLLNHFKFRNFPRDRVTFKRAASREDGKTQFWLVPPGADVPEVEEAEPEPEKPPTGPYLYAAEYVDGVPGCSGPPFDLGNYASKLKSMNGSRGRIVIGESSRAKYDRKSREIIRELTQNGVLRTRITTAFKVVRPNRAREFTELWIHPQK